MKRLRPKIGHILLLPEKHGLTSDSILIPDIAKGKDMPDRGTVAAMSGRPMTRKGVVYDFDFKIGDRVLVKKFSGLLLNVRGTEYLSVPSGDVLAILESPGNE